MTVPSHTAPVAVRDLDCALDAVRARGLRLSMARRVVVEAVFTAPGPVTAEEIARSGRCDLASVYRNLEALEAIGLIRHLHVGHGPERLQRDMWPSRYSTHRNPRRPREAPASHARGPYAQYTTS